MEGQTIQWVEIEQNKVSGFSVCYIRYYDGPDEEITAESINQLINKLPLRIVKFWEHWQGGIIRLVEPSMIPAIESPLSDLITAEERAYTG